MADPQLNGPQTADRATESATPAAGRRTASVGYVLGGPVIPPNLLADLVARGATTRVVPSGSALGAVDRYRPSAALDEFVRLRAMTCSFPGCDAPATNCDVDHVVPWPLGPTHGANLSPKCRKHHLLKTFWTGVDVWRDSQEPDGTTIWTAPTGHVYRSVPLTRVLFPDSDLSTPDPGSPPPDLRTDAARRGRQLMMPTRRRTRAQDLAARVAYERALNEEHLARGATHAPNFSNPPPV